MTVGVVTKLNIACAHAFYGVGYRFHQSSTHLVAHIFIIGWIYVPRTNVTASWQLKSG